MPYAQVVLRGRAPSGAMLNVLHYEVPEFSAGSVQEAVDQIGASWIANCASVHSLSFDMEDIYFTPEIENGIGLAYTPASWPTSGTNADDEFFPQAAMLVRKVNTNGSRPRYGRAYIGGLSTENLGSSGVWNTVARDAVRAFWEDILDIDLPVSGGSWSMVIKAANPDAPNTNAYANVNAIEVPSIGAVQRRRRYGSGS